MLGRRLLSTVTVNGRQYNKPVTKPVVAICLGGSTTDYILKAREADFMPNYNRILLREGFRNAGIAPGIMPSLTVNNQASIVTGVQADKHGITGNSFLDEASGNVVAFDQPNQLRCPTIFSGFNASLKGHPIVLASEKSHVLNLLSSGLDSSTSLAFSTEAANLDSSSHLFLKSMGVASLKQLVESSKSVNQLNSALTSLASVTKLVELELKHSSSSSNSPTLYFVSTHDTLQHRHEAGEPEAHRFYAELDALIGRLDDLGVRVGLTADHGMNHKMLYSKGAERLNIVYVQSLMDQAGIQGRLCLPIESGKEKAGKLPLGSFATIYLKDKSQLKFAMQSLRQHRGIYSVFGKDDGCAGFSLPADRVGDMILVGDRDTVLGRTPADHDLSSYVHPNNPSQARLRSHGSLEETTVPMFFNFSLTPQYSQKLSTGKARAFDLFDYLLNGAHENSTKKL